MTTSIDPSVDELLLLQENQYHIPNFVFANVKPIGAERKIGQLTNASPQVISQTESSFVPPKRLVCPINMNSVKTSSSTSFNSSTKPSTMSSYDQFHFPSMEESLIHQTNNELKSVPYHSSTSDSSTIYPSHILDNYNYQRQTSSSVIQQKLYQSIPTRPQTAKTMPSFRIPQTYPTSRFFSPHSSQLNSRNPFLNICQQTRSIPPMFTSPFQCTRERFQVNSIGRPILRANNYNHLSQAHGFKMRR